MQVARSTIEYQPLNTSVWSSRAGTMRTVDARPEFIPALLDRMPPSELALLDRLTNGRGAERIAENISLCTLTWCGLDDEGVVTFGGMMPTHPGAAYFWQMVTTALPQHKRAYIQQGRDMLARGLAHFDRLTTSVAADYGAVLRHLWRLGFTIGEPEMIRGVLLRNCERTR